MKVFALTRLGKKMAASDQHGGEEMRALQVMRANRGSATDSELEVSGVEKYVIRKLKNRGLITELTT